MEFESAINKFEKYLDSSKKINFKNAYSFLKFIEDYYYVLKNQYPTELDVFMKGADFNIFYNKVIEDSEYVLKKIDSFFIDEINKSLKLTVNNKEKIFPLYNLPKDLFEFYQKYNIFYFLSFGCFLKTELFERYQLSKAKYDLEN